MFLKTGHTEDCFQIEGKHFRLTQWLNNFAKIGDNSGAMFLRTMAGMSSGPVAFEVERLDIRKVTSFAVILAYSRVLLVRSGKSGKRTFASSRLELMEKQFAKRLALSEAEGRRAKDQ